MDAGWRVLIYSSLAAATAALGALPLVSGRTPPLRLLGWANALASGLMLGVAYALMTAGLDRGAPATGVGAIAGVAFVAAAHRVLGRLGAVLLAVVTLAMLSAAPVLLPWTLGFSVGAVLYVVMAELLPDSYRAAGRTSIALVTIVAVAIVVLLNDGAR